MRPAAASAADGAVDEVVASRAVGDSGDPSDDDSLLRAIAHAPEVFPQSAALAPGTHVGRFVIVRKLGAGGMGVVYEATDETLRRAVAIKVLPDNVTRDEERRRRLLREARSAAAITHANIATVHEVGEVDGRVFIVMELVAGETLRARLAAGALPMREALRISRAIVRGLAKAHEKGIVHRDLKPENVMLDRDGEVKILDFGLAKLRTETPTPSVLENQTTEATEEGQILGTPSYMSPEQAAGKSVDARSDVFSLGVTLYEMVTGVRPFTALTTAETVAAILRDDPDPPSRINANVDAAFERVILRALRKKPADRYASAAELLTALDEGAETTAPPRSAKNKARARPRKWIWGAAVAVSTLAVGGYMWKRASSAGSDAVSATASVSSSAARPVSTIPAAQAAYEAAMVALRRCEGTPALSAIDRALALDPNCAAAAVERVTMARFEGGQSAVAVNRALYRGADARRASLSPRDVALLDAAEPFMMREPSDLAEVRKRLDAASRAFPNDAEIVHWAGWAYESSPAEMLRRMDAALAIDPGYLDAMQGRAHALAALGRRDEALTVLAACSQQNPSSDCILDRVTALMTVGDCATAESAAKGYVAISNGSSFAYQFEAIALEGNDAPRAAVEEALRQWEAALPNDQAYLHENGFIALDVLSGRLASAKTKAHDFEVAIDRRPDGLAHEYAAFWVANLLVENATAQKTKAYADGFFARRAVWSNAQPRGVFGGGGGSISLIVALDVTGAIPHDEALHRAHAWNDDTMKISEHPDTVNAYASLVAHTPDEAAAFGDGDLRGDALPLVGEASVEWPLFGRRDLLQGRIDDAVDRLRAGTRACNHMFDPFLWVRGHLWLGQAYEKKGDTGAACDAYGFVLARWGIEKPVGRTAQEAAKRRQALGCK
jgi:serine/threonine protein kinase